MASAVIAKWMLTAPPNQRVEWEQKRSGSLRM
jgi:hypothetical protein